MFKVIACLTWSIVFALLFLGWMLDKSVITLTPEPVTTVEPLWMGISPAACRHLMDIGRTDDYFKCMGIGYVEATE